MKTALLSLLTLLVITWCCDQKTENTQTSKTSTNGYDSLLATETRADQYGIRKYVLAYLKTGPNRSQSKAEADSLQRAHLDNIKRMAQEGKLVLAGPFMDNGDIRGIYVFAVENVQEAELLTNSDPAIQAGRLVMELHPWYGSAALMKVNEIHARLSKISI